MAALNPAELAEKLKKIYKAKKRDPEDVGTGQDIRPPTFYVGLPKPITALIGCPGVASMRITQISGKPNSGKTSLAMYSMVQAGLGWFNPQMEFVAEPINTILIDTEGKFSKSRFESMGGDPNKLFKISVSTVEDAFFGLDETLSVIYAEDPNAKTLVVFDSLGGTPSAKEVETSADESVALAGAAKQIRRNLRVLLTKWLNKKDIAMLLINTSYAAIGGHGRINSGGEGAEYGSSVIFNLGRVSDITTNDGNKRIFEGIVTKATITKNHLQTKSTTLKDITFEIYANEIKSINKYKIKRGAEFINDDGRLSIIKVNRKDETVSYTIKKDRDPASIEGLFKVEELVKYLEENNYDQLPDEE